MKNIGPRFLGIIVLISIFTVGLSAKINSAESSREKIKPEVLLAKHLNAIGSAEALKSFKSIMVRGTTKAVFQGRGKGLLHGLVVLASEGEKNMIGMKFNNASYRFETMGYDGNVFTVGYASPGVRSVLGGFLRVNQKTFKRGLLGGVLSTSWELLNYNVKKGKLKYSGKTKKDGKKLYKFTYYIKKGSDLDVMLFFDAETFRHVRTEYKRVFTSGLGRATGNTQRVAISRVDNSAQQSETRHKMIEEFGDFKIENGLTLPHKYDLRLEIQTGNGSTKDHFSMVLQDFIFNENIDDASFRVG